MVVQVTLWDSRTGEGGGCVQRLVTHGAELPLYAVAADSTGTFLGERLKSSESLQSCLFGSTQI